MSPTDVDPIPTVAVGPPSFDFLGLLEKIYSLVADYFPAAFSGAKHVLGALIGLSFPVALFFVIGIVYCVEQLKYIRRKEEQLYDAKTEPAERGPDNGNAVLSSRWERVQRHIESPNENDWKQAIMEADIMLDDILTSMGYRGESIGEKLKRVEPGDFRSLQDAWDAHKVRNQIAHEPGFVLGQQEAKRTINLYRAVFEEFYYI